jgi:hypothetical protein
VRLSIALRLDYRSELEGNPSVILRVGHVTRVRTPSGREGSAQVSCPVATAPGSDTIKAPALSAFKIIKTSATIGS